MSDSSDPQAQARFQSFLKEAINHAPHLPVVSKLQELPFTALSWKTFEQLCCRMVAELPNVEGEPYLYGIPGQDQKGIDIVARIRAGDRLERWCFQCKKIEHLTPNKLAKAIETLEYAADRYFFLVASSVGTELQDIIEPHDDKELWDCRILSKKLKDHPNLVAEFFGEHWLFHFSNSKTESPNSQQETGHANSLGSFNLPNPAPYFVGRQDEINLLTSYLDLARSIVIEGSGGSGKTQLVIKTLDGRDDRSTVWIDVESYLRVQDLQIALSNALQQIGVAASVTNLIQVLHMVPIRVVFDGVEQATREDWDEMEDFFRLLLTRTRTPQFIFTSQVTLNNLEPDYQLSLKPLEPEYALKILQARGIQGKELNFAEENALNWLVSFAEGHTLTLRLIAAHLQRFGNPSTVVQRIQQLGSSALDQPRRKKHTRSTSLNIALRLAYEALSSEQKALLLYLSYFPGGCWHHWLQGVSPNKDIEVDLAEICSWYLFEREQDYFEQIRYRVLSPIRIFIQATEEAINRNTAVTVRREVVKHLASYAVMLDSRYMQFGNASLGAQLFEIDLSNFFAAVEYAYAEQNQTATNDGEEHEEISITAYGLASGLSTYLFVRGHLHQSIEILRKGIDAGRKLGYECERLYRQLIVTYQRIQDREGIDIALSEFGAVAEQSTNLDLRAQYTQACGDAAYSRSQYKQADVHYQKVEQYYAAVLAETTKAEDVESQKATKYLMGSLTLALACRARVHEHLGNFQLGVDFGLRALDLFRSTGDQINPPNVKFHIGRCYLGLKEYDRAHLAFAVAALQFHLAGTQQYLSNSLAEIGVLAVREHIQISELAVTEEIILDGLSDVTAEIRRALSTLPKVQLSWGFEITRKCFAIMALASYRAEPQFLIEWALESRQSLIEPLFESGLVSKQNISEPGILLREFDLIVCAAWISAKMRSSDTLSTDDLQPLCFYCYEMIAHGGDVSPFHWLATWINLYYSQQIPVTAEQLREASIKTFKHGQPFDIGRSPT